MLKNQKGITLIALIITIIVMLILVGVTINVALNGGLFQKASEASEQMQIEAEKEELLSAVVAAIGTDGKVDFNYLDNNLPTEWSKVTDKTYKSPKNNIYEVDDYGKITYKGKNTGGENEPAAFDWTSVGLTVDTNAEYSISTGGIATFSTDGKVKIVDQSGQILFEIDATNEDNITDGKIDCEVTINGSNTNAKMRMNEEDESDENIYCEVEGMGTITLVKTEKNENPNIYTNEEVLEALGITNYTGTYTGTWTKIGEENGKIKLVSTSEVANYTLGYNDPKAINAIPATDESAPTETENLERSIWSYKNAVNSLNTVAQEATGIASAESIEIEDIYDIIGEENVNKETSYGIQYNYYYNTEDSKVYCKYETGTDENGEIIWSTGSITGYSSQTFVDDNGNTVVVDSENDNVTLTHTSYNYDLTEDQKAEIGSLASRYYWLASPCVSCSSDYAYFFVRFMSYGNIGDDDLFGSYGGADGSSLGVRAVVSVSGL